MSSTLHEIRREAESLADSIAQCGPLRSTEPEYVRSVILTHLLHRHHGAVKMDTIEEITDEAVSTFEELCPYYDEYEAYLDWLEQDYTK